MSNPSKFLKQLGKKKPFLILWFLFVGVTRKLFLYYRKLSKESDSQKKEIGKASKRSEIAHLTALSAFKVHKLFLSIKPKVGLGRIITSMLFDVNFKLSDIGRIISVGG